MMLSRLVVVVVVLLGSGSATQAQSPPASAGTPDQLPAALMAHRTGAFTATLPTRSAESAPDRWTERFQFTGRLDNWDYDLETESFSFYVPPEYDADDEPWGVLVWISPFDDGAIPPEFEQVLSARRLIWVGPDGAGNRRHLFPRAGLVLDAASNLRRFYNVDPARIFVSGLSGGGRMAAMIAVDYPDVFAGGFPIIGVTTHLDVPLESTPGLLVPRFPGPDPDLLDRARQQPFVIMTGSGDFNREECRLTAQAMRRDGFTALHFLDVDGMGHEMPSPGDFARGLDLLLGRP